MISLVLTLAAIAGLAAAPLAELAGSTQQAAGRSADDIWLVTNQRPAGADERTNIVGQYAVVNFNKARFDARLAAVGRDTDIAPLGIVMSLPMPDGTFGRFLVNESPMLAPELAAAFPEIKTYSGQGIDDPTATTRFGWTAAGFHSILLSGEAGTVYIDPYTQGNTDTYVVFNKADYRKPGEAWVCMVAGEHIEALHRSENAFPMSNGTSLRTYRLALAATAEYTAAAPATTSPVNAAGSKGAALARMTVTMNRVNGIYERELAVRMTVATGPSGGDATALIFTDAAADGYTNTDGSAMLTENQTKLDAVILTANYDIGHVFSTGGGGVAYLGSPCSATLKAGGVTGSANPTGDAFDVDYVAHEIGHQFGGNHTFNGSTNSCSSTSHRAAHAYEVGSGVTIQAYAGICGVENLQGNSIDRFHTESLDEMTAFLTNLTTGGSCGTATATNNTPPVINGGNPLTNYSIPLGTPFMLTGNATDTDTGDSGTMTYTWDQFDLGTASTSVLEATTDLGNRPLFRSYAATASGQRSFPSATYVLTNANVPPTTYACTVGGVSSTCLTGETMPTTARTMNFQLTARDNRAGGGAFSTQSMTVTTVASTGPFKVTSQTTNASVAPGATPVTWDVAGTTASPINVANVRILLSTDGGITFPTELLATTPNDGTQSVDIPNFNTSQARIKVEALLNIFFDVNDTNFTISGTATVPGTPAAPTGTAGNASVSLAWTAPTTDGGSPITGYQVQSSTTSGGTYTNVPACPTNTTTTSCTISGLTNGTAYFFKVAAINLVGTGSPSPASTGITPSSGGGGTASVPSAPDAPTGTAGNATVSLSWIAPSNGGSAISGYQVQQSTSASGTYTNANGCPANSTTTNCTVSGLTNGTAYFFKVAAINGVGTGSYSAASSGITPVAPCSYTLGSDRASVDRLVSNEAVTVTTTPACAWTATVASDSSSMLSISSGASSTGSGTVAYQVSQNPSTTLARTGTITIAGQTFTVTQSADSYTVDVTVQTGTTPVAGAFVALIGTGTARAGADMDADFAADGTRRKFGAVSGSTGIARFRGVVPGTFTMRAHSGGRSVTSGTITVSATSLSATLAMLSSSSALTTLGAYGAQTGSVVADGQTGVFYQNTTAIPSLYRTTDHGGNWSPVTLSSDDPATGLDASSTASAPTTNGRGGEIATIVGNKTWYSFDFGLTWASMTSPTGVSNTSMYWAHIADTASTVSFLFFTGTGSADIYMADMTASTPAFSAMASSYKTNGADMVAMGNGSTAPVIAVFDVVSGATKFWAVDATPASTDSSLTVSGGSLGLAPVLATDGTTALTPGNATLFKIGGPATGVSIGGVSAPNTVLIYSLTSGAGVSNARMTTCTASSCTFPTATTFKNTDDTTSTTSSFSNTSGTSASVSLCSANSGAVGSIATTGGFGSVGQCWVTSATGTLEVRAVGNVNNNTGMAYDAAYDGSTNLVIISGDGQHGVVKSARMTTSADMSSGLNRPYFPGYPTIAAAGTGSTTGGIAVQGITSAVIRQSIYQPGSTTNMASLMSFTGGGRTIGSTDAGVTWFTLADRGGSRMDWWTGATSGSQWIVMGTGGAGNWMYGTKLAAATDFTDATTMPSVLNSSAQAVGPTEFAMSASVVQSPGVYGVRGISGTDYVGLGSYDGAKLRIDLSRLTYASPSVTLGTLIPLFEIAIPDPYVASDATANAATGTNAGSIRMAYCPTSGSHATVADTLFVALGAINSGGTSELRKIQRIGAGAALTTPSFSDILVSSLTAALPTGSNLRDIAVNCADGTVWLARASQQGGGGGGTPSAGILKSTDGGGTFTAITLPAGNAGTALQNVVALDFNKTTTTQIVAVSRSGDVLVSDDSAATWRLVNDTSQAACLGATTQCGRGFGGEEPGGFTMPPATGTTDAIAGDSTGAPVANVTTSRGVLGSGAGLFSVSLDAPGTVTVTPSTLNFAATKAGSGGAITGVTAAQTLTVAFSSGAPSWTVSSNQTWLELSALGGTGAGVFTASIANPSNVLGASTSLQATITLSAPGTSNTPRTITVNLTIDQTNGATVSAPIGQVDTPAQSATGVQGAIGVTGWVLDNVGVTGVKIYRNCLTFENQASCQIVLGNNVVEVGDAAFLAGARTDVESSFSSFPQNNRAGWGYLMLTSMLPHVTGERAYGGQGPLTIYAVATDVEGNKKLLGRSSDPASADFTTPTQITMANDSIAKPFGAIDTPAQGATVSGSLNNFGWALTPDSNTTGGEAGDILIATNGSTMTVFIDSLPTALVAYNQCRGNVGNPVPSGVFCNDDVANIFGNPTPQAVFTARTTNPTLFRNLDATRAAIGVYTFNTATFSNGLHTIAWSVSDSAGRNEGIGSRFFNVLNSGADQRSEAALRSAPADVQGSSLLLGHLRPAATEGVYGRTGFDLATSWTQMHANDDGRYAVRLPEMGRLELWLGDAVDAGYLVANGTLRALPTGSALRLAESVSEDSRTSGLQDLRTSSVFGWMPPVGYIGDYQLAFVRGDARIDVTVTVVPTPGAPDDAVAQIRMHLDDVHPQCSVLRAECSVRIDGWSFDPQASIGSGIGTVHVWARKLDLTGLKAGEVAGEQPPFFLGAATVETARPDVARAFAGAPPHTGFTLTTALAPGTYELTAYVWNARTARWEDARSVTTIVR